MDTDSPILKAVASVADVARMVGLSRERFYQLQRAGVFLMPLYDLKTRRPFYTEEMQRECLEVRRRNCGINGKPVLFYCRGRERSAPKSVRSRSPQKKAMAPTACSAPDWVTEGVNGLGLDVTSQDVERAMKEKFPGGVGDMDRGAVIREVFLHLTRQNRNDNVNG
jgi:hypothetical protein